MRRSLLGILFVMAMAVGVMAVDRDCQNNGRGCTPGLASGAGSGWMGARLVR